MKRSIDGTSTLPMLSQSHFEFGLEHRAHFQGMFGHANNPLRKVEGSEKYTKPIRWQEPYASILRGGLT